MSIEPCRCHEITGAVDRKAVAYDPVVNNWSRADWVWHEDDFAAAWSPESKTSIPRVGTGIKGLNEILHGGWTANRLYLIEGMPGSGKTTLAFQFLLEGVRLGEQVLYLTPTSRRDRDCRIPRTSSARTTWRRGGGRRAGS